MILSFITLLLLQSHANAATPSALVHLFDWNWNEITQECESVLGPLGVSAVQVAPPQEHRVLNPATWYDRYQPVSYQLESRGGTRAEFAQMVSRCQAVGVTVVVDTVINHMASSKLPEELGSAGTIYTPYRFPGLYEASDFHRCGLTPDGTIQDFDNREQVLNCELFRLPDLATSTPKVRAAIAGYFTDLMSLGVEGFRIDAAKHIPARDLQAILGPLKTSGPLRLPRFLFSEVIDWGNGPINTAEYTGLGHVTEFRYGPEVTQAFRRQDLRRLLSLGERAGWVPSYKAIVFIDNHDTQRAALEDFSVLTYRERKIYALAQVFSLAWTYGTPAVMSSYAFDHVDQPRPPTEALKGIGWIREHRWPEIAPMFRFRKAVDAEPKATDSWAEGGRMAFGRGALGFVVINASNASMDQSLKTSFPPGTRVRDVISGKTLEVAADGTIRAQLERTSAMALLPLSRTKRPKRQLQPMLLPQFKHL